MDNRDRIRQDVWNLLREVAKPDSRFHFDFSEFIADFEGSERAVSALAGMDIYRRANVVFVTPDNCLERLRAQVILDEKTLLITTYGIRRGFMQLRRKDVPVGLEEYAVLLDVIERFGHYCSLAEIQELGNVDLLVTGGSAVTPQGARFGKGHGFFDLEWAMLYSIGAADVNTPVVDIVHDCQIIDAEILLMPFDTICDLIITPSQVLRVEAPQKPTGGVLWELLEDGMLEKIPPLEELLRLQTAGRLRTAVGPTVRSATT